MESINGTYVSNEHVEQSQLAIEHIEHEIQGNCCGATVAVVFDIVCVCVCLNSSNGQCIFNMGIKKNIEHIERELNTYVGLDKQLCGFGGEIWGEKCSLMNLHWANTLHSFISVCSVGNLCMNIK